VKEIGGIVVIDLGTNEKSQGYDDLRLSLLHMYVARVRMIFMWNLVLGSPLPLGCASFMVVASFLLLLSVVRLLRTKGTQ
jgi:hypothetical protein